MHGAHKLCTYKRIHNECRIETLTPYTLGKTLAVSDKIDVITLGWLVRFGNCCALGFGVHKLALVTGLIFCMLPSCRQLSRSLRHVHLVTTMLHHFAAVV
jgi:hypothetical protein